MDDREENLIEWNKEHKRLWKALCKLSVVKRNDTSKFIKFSEFFENHIELNHRPPTLNECLDFFKYM